MNKLFLTLLFLCFIIPLASASFPLSHEGHILQAFEDVQSPLIQKCTPYLAECLDATSSSDVGILHYSSSDSKLLGSYIFPHVSSGLETCYRDAGADIQGQCWCLCSGVHIVEDSFSHNLGGYTQKCISKYLGSNLFSHMSCEQDFETKLVKQWTKEGREMITNGQLEYYDSKYLDSLFTETGGNSKYLKLMNSVAGVDLTNDAKIIRSAYQNKGFYDSVYKDKQKLPFWMWGISIGLIIIGLLMIIIMFIFGSGKYKWMQIFQWTLIMIIGIVIVYSFFMGTTWKLTTYIVEVPTYFGLYTISDSDVKLYDTQIQNAVNKYFTDGILPVSDSSGLSYYDKEGKYHVGALTQSEKGFKVLWYWFIIPIFSIFNIYSLYQALSKKKKKR
jgi:hypothetical protein